MAKTTIEKLEKTLETINNHIDRGNRVTNRRSYELIVRYNELSYTAIGERVWQIYCDKHNMCRSHNAGDLFA